MPIDSARGGSSLVRFVIRVRPCDNKLAHQVWRTKQAGEQAKRLGSVDTRKEPILTAFDDAEEHATMLEQFRHVVNNPLLAELGKEMSIELDKRVTKTKKQILLAAKADFAESPVSSLLSFRHRILNCLGTPVRVRY